MTTTDEWQTLRHSATPEESRIIDFYESMVRHNTNDGSLQKKVLPLLNRIVTETGGCYEYRQNAAFYAQVFDIVRRNCVDSDGTMDPLVTRLKALVAVSKEEMPR